MIRIQRDSGYADRLRDYKIAVDGNVVGKIGNDQQLELNVPSGKHQLQLMVDWCRSNVVQFEMKEDVIEFECGSNLRGLKIFLAPIYITFLRSKYLWLRKK